MLVHFCQFAPSHHSLLLSRRGEQKAKRKGTINTVGAGFLGVMSGVLFALLCVYGVPAIRSKLANRRGRNYSPADDEGIETPERGGEAI